MQNILSNILVLCFFTRNSSYELFTQSWCCGLQFTDSKILKLFKENAVYY